MPVMLTVSILLLLAAGSAAQDDTAAPAPSDTAEAEPADAPDTVVYFRTPDLEKYAPVTDTVDLETNLYQNPTTALFKSMIIPGWGQWGNRRYIKAILFAGVDAWLIGSAVHFGGQASDLRDQYEAATDLAERNRLYGRYSDKRDQRNKYTWFAVIVSFISMFDAYVDAHLSGFPDRDRVEGISFEMGPDREGGVSASVTVPF